MAKQGFRSIGNTPYIYQDTNGSSVSFGIDDSDTTWKLNTGPMVNVEPGVNANIEIDPSSNGNTTIRPNGIGSVRIQSANVSTTGGVIQAEITTGALSATKGTDGQLLIGNSSNVPAWGSLTSPLGTISIVYDSGNIEIDGSSTGLIQQINGNFGAAIPVGGIVDIVTANTTVSFEGSGNILTLDFNAPGNLLLGSEGTFISSSVRNTSLGQYALNKVDTTIENVALGFESLASIQTNPGFNTAIGTESLGALGDGNGGNTGLGWGSGGSLAVGSYNTFLGYAAGWMYDSGQSSNISINHPGSIAGGGPGDFNTLRIGSATGSGNQELTSAYICGIDGVNVGSVAKVLTMASDQIGTATITAGPGISIIPGANSIEIEATGFGAFSWVVTTGGTASVNTGYFTNNGAALVTITLPSSAAVGDTIRLSGLSIGGWLIAQNSGQSINFNSGSTTVGVSGSVASTAQYDSIEIVCCVANTTFNVVSSTGNLTIV